MLAVLVVDLGLALTGIGLLSTPLLGLTLTGSVAVVTAGLGLLLIGLLAPTRPWQPPGPPMDGLDALIPAADFGEHHETVIDAPAPVVFAAVKAVTAREIRFFRLLTFLRSPHLGRATESILNPAPDRPILDVATDTQFVLLHDDPDRELAVGILIPPGRQRKPASRAEFQGCSGSWSRAVMNFHLSAEAGDATRLVTETRIASSDGPARRGFAVYWRLIYPGSAFIRHEWLRAIRRRALATAGAAVR